MKAQGLVAGWILTAVAVVAALAWLVGQWNTLGRLGASARSEHVRLTAELADLQRAVQAELTAHAELVKDIRWSPDRGSAADVVRRLAVLAQGGQAKVMMISPLERESTPRFRKSWHRIEMFVPFHDLIDFAARVEEAGGVLEDVTLELARDASGGERGPRELRSQFRLTAVEPSDEGRAIMDRALAAARAAGVPVAASLTLPLGYRSDGSAVGLRDPFRPTEKPRPPVSVASARRPVVAAATTAVQAPPVPPPPGPVVPMSVKGIVKFPGGAMAIVNDQIVGVGDLLDGHRVQDITDGKIVLREPGGTMRVADLPGFTAVSRSTR